MSNINYTYREKHKIIQAFQMTEGRRLNNEDWPKWLHEAWNKDKNTIGSISPINYPNSDGTDKLILNSMEQMILIDWND